jgi:hypothetical protein
LYLCSVIGKSLLEYPNIPYRNQNMYPREMVKPMRAELNDAGFQDLYSADE